MNTKITSRITNRFGTMGVMGLVLMLLVSAVAMPVMAAPTDPTKTGTSTPGMDSTNGVVVASDGTKYVYGDTNGDFTSGGGAVIEIAPDGTTTQYNTSNGNAVTAAALSPDGSTLYMAHGNVSAINLSDGSTAWQYTGSSYVPALATSSGTVYASTGSGSSATVRALSATDGTEP